MEWVAIFFSRNLSDTGTEPSYLGPLHWQASSLLLTHRRIPWIDEVIKEGKDLYNFLWEVIKYVKDILIYKTSKETGTYTESEVKEIEEISNMASSEKFLNIIYELSDLENNIKWSFQNGSFGCCH